MNFLAQVTDCVLLHYSGRWRGNHKQIRERYSLGRSSGKQFVTDCKTYAYSNGMVFVYDKDLNTFTCVDGRSDYTEQLVRQTLKNHYNQGKSVRRDMGTLYKEDQIGDELSQRFNANQTDYKGIGDALSDRS